MCIHTKQQNNEVYIYVNFQKTRSLHICGHVHMYEWSAAHMQAWPHVYGYLYVWMNIYIDEQGYMSSCRCMAMYVLLYI